MLLDDDDIREMIAAIGDNTTASVGTINLAVVFNADSSTRLDGEEMITTGPYAVASTADVVALGLTGGNNGSTLTIDGQDYTVLAMDPDGSGATILSLMEVR